MWHASISALSHEESLSSTPWLHASSVRLLNNSIGEVVTKNCSVCPKAWTIAETKDQSFCDKWYGLALTILQANGVQYIDVQFKL